MEDTAESVIRLEEISLEVVNGLNDDKSLLDIVAVHGLGGHCHRSWVTEAADDQKECIWLKGLLPKHIPQARIMEFTWQPSTTERISIFSSERLTKIAQRLLELILGKRKGDKYHDRPVAFLGHDVGGIIVKKALVMAESNAAFSSISQRSNRLVFFGTPHRVLNTSEWDNVIFNIISSYQPSIGYNYNMATRVKTLSKAIEHVSNEFISLPVRHCIVNVFQDTTGDKVAVISRYSATTGLVHETNIARRCRYGDLSRFINDGPESEFSLIVKNLAAETNLSYADCLSALFNISPSFAVFRDEQDIYMQSQTALHDKFKEWQNSASSHVITSCGVQGFGMSLNARSLFHGLSKPSFPSYFAFSGSDVRRQSAVSFLSSIIFQIINQDQDKFKRIESLYAAMKLSGAWTQAGLLVLFQALLDQESHDPLYLIVDRLDKCDSSWRALMDMLLSIFSNNQPSNRIKLAIFTESNQDIEKVLAKFGDSRMNGPDMADHAPELLVGALAENIIGDIPELSPLKSQILESLGRCKDSTDLLLSLHSLNNMDIAPRSLASLRRLMGTFPPDLEDAVVTRIDSMCGWSRVALGWLMCAKRPFRLHELATAVALTDNNGKFASPFETEELPIDMAAELDSAFGFLVKIENGQVLISTDIVKKGIRRVLAHEQVSTKVEAGKATIPDDAQITKILLEYLISVTKDMERALESTEYVRPSGSRFDLAHYAAQFWPAHYRAIETHDNHMDNLLDLLDGGNKTLVLSKLVSELNIAAPSSELLVTDPLLLAAQLGLAGIVQERQDRLINADRELAIELASWSGYTDVVEILLRDAERTKTCRLSRALKYASARGYDGIVENLLEYLASTENLEPDLLDELICQSTQLGYKPQVSLFLRYNPNVEVCLDGKTPLQHAAQNGHAAIVHYLLSKAKADVDAKAGGESSSPILLATEGGYQTVVQTLLDFGADIAGRPSKGQQSTALHVAAERGHEGIVRLLVDHLAVANPQPASGEQGSTTEESVLDINTRNEFGRSPLTLACIKGHTAVASVLLDRGADIKLVDNSGNTALYYATTPNSKSLSEVIIKRAAAALSDFADIGDVFLRSAKHGITDVARICIASAARVNGVPLKNFRDGDSQTALHLAAREGHDDIISLLWEAGAMLDEVDDRGQTPLTVAALAGKINIVKMLLEAGADPLRKNAEEETIVTQVAYKNCSSVYADIIDILIDSGVDPNSVDSSRHTALHRAVAADEADVVECLLRHGARFVKDRQLWNPLHYAALNSSNSGTKIAKILLEAGAEPLDPEEDGWIPLHFASSQGNVPMLELLWKAAPDSLDEATDDGRTVIHLGYDEPRSLKWIIDHNVDIDSLNANNETTLMLAAAGGWKECVNLLLDRYANVRLCDEQGRTCLHHAADGGDVDIGRRLLKTDQSLLSYEDDAGLTALYVAILEENLDFALMLLQEHYTSANLAELSAPMGEDGELPLINAIKDGDSRVVERLLELGVDAEVRDKDGRSALALALEDGKEMVRLLLSPDIPHRANVNAGGGRNPTALYQVASSGSIDLARTLISLGASVDGEGGELNTALSAASYYGHDEMVKLLLQEDADPKKHGGDLPNALGAAIHQNNQDLVTILIEAGVELNAQDPQGRTCLHIAASRALFDIFYDLFDAGADPTIKDKQGRTIFHHAAAGGDVDIIESLLEDTSLRHLNVEDINGWTPLHWAARQDGSLGVAMALVEHGADPTSTTPDGWTPENIAVFHDADDMAELMTEEAAKKAKPTTGDEAQDGKESKPEGPVAESRQWKTGYFHRQFSCDGCFIEPIYGVRWRCTDRNFDYCFKCYWTAEETQPGQKWERLPKSSTDHDRIPQREEHEMDSGTSLSAGSDDDRSDDD
ncbi:ankyrin repeat-containing domain protein [Trichoderma chlorosporum]